MIILTKYEKITLSTIFKGAGAVHHPHIPLVLPEAKVHHRLGRLLQRVPAATFIYIIMITDLCMSFIIMTYYV